MEVIELAPPAPPPPPPAPPPPPLSTLPPLAQDGKEPAAMYRVALSSESDRTQSGPTETTDEEEPQSSQQDVDGFSSILQQHQQMLNTCHTSLEFALRAYSRRSLSKLGEDTAQVAMQLRSPTDPDFSTALNLPGSLDPPDKVKSSPVVTSGMLVSNPASTTNATRAAKKAQEKMMKTLARSKTHKFQKDGKRADDYLTAHGRKHAEEFETKLEQFVTSVGYECASMSLILVNCVFLCAQTQHIGNEMLGGHGHNAGRETFWVLGNTCFCVLYAIDLILRWYADGILRFFLNKDRWWNAFDVLIIGLAIVELGLDLTNTVDEASHRNRVLSISMLRVLRILRVVRVLRIINMFGAFFLQLRSMIHSLLQSVVNMFWVGVVFTLIWMVFGIVFTIGVAEYCIQDDRWQADETANIRLWFGTLDRSTFSLFMAITGGRDWGDYYDALKDLPILISAAYMFYIWFLVIVAMNIVTGIFVEGAMKTAKLEREFLIQQELQEKEQYAQDMQRLFEEMDTSNSGGITLQEFETHLHDDRAIAYFNALEIDFNEATTLFTLLDTDKSGSVDFQEFLVGCEKLQGNARSIDLAMMHYEVRWLASAVLDFRDSMAMPILS